jgi:hypothetical protein
MDRFDNLSDSVRADQFPVIRTGTFERQLSRHLDIPILLQGAQIQAAFMYISICIDAYGQITPPASVRSSKPGW